MDFNNKFAIVTGGSRGIGKKIVENLVANGCEVLFTGTKPKNTTSLLNTEYIQLNLDDNNSLQHFIDYLKSNVTKIDILVNNAGTNIISEIDKIDRKSLETVLNVNLIGPALITSKVSEKMMSKNYGRIVNISSIYGLVSRSGRVSYSSSKSGLVGQTKAVALDLAKSGILVNSVCPGFVETDLTEKILGKIEMDALKTKIPLGRLATPNDIASSVLFLASDLNTYITGQTLVVDGGYIIE